jgi:BlaI family transcriptional regulator, penicillinase repressor
MAEPRISRFEFQLLEKLWDLGPCSVREVQESLPEKDRPAYTTVQTMLYRLEEKGVVRRVKKIGNAHLFQAVATRKAVHRRLIGDLLNFFGGSAAPVVSHLLETGKLTLADIKELEKRAEALEKKP